MIRHLDHCEPCRQEVSMLAEFAAAAGTTGRATRSGWWLAVAASLVTVVGAGLWYQGKTDDRDELPVDPLVAATARLEYRLVRPRLSGKFGWAGYREPVRSSIEVQDPKLLKLKGAAGDVLLEAEAKPTAENTHAAAIAMLLLQNPRSAIEALKKVTAERPNDARAWSDLAAAYDEAAIRYGRRAEDSLALAAADRAIRLDPKLAAAHFNRALILEHLGVTFEARDAWKKYLELDPSSEWAREARAQLEVVSRPPEQSQFDAVTPQLERDAAARNLAAVRTIVDRFPQLSRVMAEVDTLGRWSDAFRAGKNAEAEREFAIARTIGDALRGRGEELTAAMVSAIANAPLETRTRLAAAFASYRDGRKALEQSMPQMARRKMLDAAALFGDTPAGWSARHFAAVGSEQAGDYETAERELSQVSAITPSGFKAQRAQIEWDRGLVQGRLAQWPAALKHLATSLTLFTELGERGNAAWIQSLNAEVATLLGRRDDAWRAWAAALPVLSEQGTRKQSAFLNAVSRMELVAGNPEAARSLAEIELRHGDPDGPIRAEVLFRLALLYARAGDHAGAVAAIADGQRVAARLKDETIRRNTLVDFRYAEGITWSTAEPYRALEALTRAVQEHRGGCRPMLLPATLYERAQILRTLNRRDEAQTDLQYAIATVESQRKPVEWRDTKSGALDGADQIYAELAELLLERGRTREAFAITDRAAAFAFYGAGATGSVITLDALQQQLPSDSLIIEYLVRPRRTYIFVVGARTFEVRAIDIASADVIRLAATLDETLRRPAPLPHVTRASAAMEKTLLGPIRELLPGANDLTFIPDPLIASVPMSVLVNPSSERWLVEDHSIRIAASALYRHPVAREHSSRVVVISPSGGVSLPRTEAEVGVILRLHPKATLLQGDAATVASVIAAMNDAGMIHYAGHAGGEGDAGLILRADDDKPEVLRGDDITPLRAAPLVVLAGCRTLRGGARREDLATSLGRAFLLAGASSVVGTSWDVEDPIAAIFFSRFHELNSATGNPVTALSEAQRSMLHDRRRHPAEWAFAQIVVRSINP